MKEIRNSNRVWESIEDDGSLPEDVSDRIWRGVDHKFRKYRRRRILKIGVLAALIPIFSMFLIQHNSKSVASTLVYQTGAQADTVVLSDGSTIYMQANTKMVVSADFGRSSRHLTFNGRGYFDIAKDKSKPFIIDAVGFSVEVLGTKFNLSGSPSEQKVELIEGKVKVNRGDTPVYLVANQVWRYSERLGEQNYLMPVSRQTFSFQKENFGTVIALLEKRYGVSIDYPGELKQSKVSGEFNGDLEQILRIVTFPFNLNVHKLDENEIILK